MISALHVPCDRTRRHRAALLGALALLLSITTPTAAAEQHHPLCYSGRYPHLAMFNHGGECGIGAVVPWAGRLWALTYSPHQPRGSDDKLYEIDADLNLRIRSESIGGTPANRLIHRESQQLFIGPYAIDRNGKVRVIPYKVAPGRPTATMRHLTDPANKVYTFTMEEGLYEIDVHTLEVKTIHLDSHVGGFVDYLPGYHGKGGYSSQGRVVVSNNGRKGRLPGSENLGCLAEWDGTDWAVVDGHQFNEVTGPGGVRGAADDADNDEPIWATGWDKRSVLLLLRDAGTWYRFRLPIGDYSYTAAHGWYTEWPRIRQIGPGGEYLMNMHGLWFDFPKTFSAANTAGLRPIASYLKITGDFCRFGDRLVFACDDTAITGGNRFVNQSQSNLWFATWAGLRRCGRPAGFGGVWVGDDLEAGATSDPYHFAGYENRVVHLTHETDVPVTFTFELDCKGNTTWATATSVTVLPKGYAFHVFPDDLQAEWIRVRAERGCDGATVYFHFGPGGGTAADPKAFAALADIDDGRDRSVGIIRPRGGDLGTLQMLGHRASAAGAARCAQGYYEIGPDMKLKHIAGEDASLEFLKKTAGLKGADFKVDAASAIVESSGVRYRLPVGAEGYDRPWSVGWPRGIREVVTERLLLNCCGTFYVLPHTSAGGISGIKPVATHNKRITDFCSWRGMTVLAGACPTVQDDGRVVTSDDANVALWFGDVDDLWQLGKPRGRGGPWRNAPVETDKPSDPYLMTGYDRKRVEFSHDADADVAFTIEVDFLRTGTWRTYKTIDVSPGETATHTFPDGFSAHWARVAADRTCTATAWFVYE